MVLGGRDPVFGVSTPVFDGLMSLFDGSEALFEGPTSLFALMPDLPGALKIRSRYVRQLPGSNLASGVHRDLL